MGRSPAARQVSEVAQSVGRAIGAIASSCTAIPTSFDVVGADATKGAFFPTLLLYCDDPFDGTEPHDIEAFGPVNTVMPYRTLDEAIELAKLGQGSLVGSLFTADDDVAREVVLGTAAYHGRLMVAQPPQREGVDRPRLAAAAPGARRTGARRRRRGDGRRARRAALHAAHGAAGLAARRSRASTREWMQGRAAS